LPSSRPLFFMSLAELRAALEAELAATPEFYDFKVLHSEPEGALWRISLEPGYVFAEGQPPGLAAAQALLDDSLDGASAWWGAPQRGAASVLALLPEADQLLLQNASAPPPGAGHLIRLYPPRFLKPLAEAWWDASWAPRAWDCLTDLAAPETVDEGLQLSGAPFRWLREGQRRALTLPRHSSAFLWGPPGTGKTTTLGVMLAEYLEARPQARVLLLSSTNAAVDLATLAVDKALQKGRREVLRPTVQRLGTHFNAAAYAGREHLIPSADSALLARLSRAASLQVLRRSRLVSMTASRACFTLRSLRELAGPEGADEPPFDLLVFDEASQLSLAQALVLMPLGRARLFAGDPQQLAPVLRSRERGAQRWLGRSAFGEMPRGAAAPSGVLLDGQARMAAPIGELVSELFYEGALRVAADSAQRPDWLAARRRALGEVGAESHVQLQWMRSEGAWSASERGPLRRESAEAIAQAVAQALEGGNWRAEELIVLTPFRAQRALIRHCLRRRGVALDGEGGGLRVSTVHRAQGSEAPVVFFDPADAAQPFLQTEAALRLLNVALSRAEAKVLVYLSRRDAEQPLLAPLVQRLRLAADGREALPLERLATQPDFPANALGRRVMAGRHRGEIVRVSPDGRQFWLVNERSGATQLFDTAFWRAKAGQTP
ncbi:DEAD/DEAH box helicase, partial [Roseateles sp.]|uniref:DEAD/DEAH box helicase n=1 Tax=Roseateles sp. TaxID=1971397 RepID=UPI00391ADEFA